MAKGVTLLIVLVCGVVGQALSPLYILSLDDQAKLKAVFEQAQPFTDLANAHYSILGLKLFSATIPKAQEACTYLKATVDTSNVQSVYHATSAAKALGNCQLQVSSAQQVLSTAINDSTDVATIFYAVSALTTLGLQINAADVIKALDAALKKDDGVLASSYALHIANMLPKDTNVDKYFELIEDVVAQADEVDEKYLQFDSLGHTAIFVDGAYKLAAKVDKTPLITEDQAVMFANYVLSRKSTQTVRNAYYVLLATKAFSSNKFQIPVSFALSGSMAISSTEPSLQVRVSNLMAGDLGKLTVKATSVTIRDGNDAHLSNTAMTAAKEPSVYQLNLLQSKPAPGFYNVELEASPAKPDKRLIGLGDGLVVVKVTTEVAVENVEVSIVDKDQSITAKTVKVVHPRKIDKGLEADHHQNVVLKFNLRDKSGQPITVHQTFVRLANLKTGQEVIFTAEADNSKTYKFNLDVAESGRDYFQYLSGKYTLELIVGDAVVQNPLLWNLADVVLKFPDEAEAKPVDKTRYTAKPEIIHQFRKPEKRPSVMVSNAFSVLVFVPLIMLFAVWAKLGVNLKNFPASPSAIGFHVGLAAIFGLFYCYWCYLNMFQTLRYLSVIGFFTFICGHRLLSHIAASKSKRH
ncbi:dolichyl-diphosphooligosaccharide--protein glycosyltransferase subunit 2-like [Amphiura filiformis]|uniref:dolichyl-diphosphooligosaccharide--protein glycosyltransferase subunit 2-like n=1 Tax=Amphiura filiformis TaxID=82378 RepID=UPI003B22087B